MSQRTCCGKRSHHWHVLYSRRDMNVVGPPPYDQLCYAKIAYCVLGYMHHEQKMKNTCVSWVWFLDPPGLRLQGWQDPLAESRAECPTNAERCRCAPAAQHKGRFEWICAENPCVLSRLLITNLKSVVRGDCRGSVDVLLWLYSCWSKVHNREFTRSIEASLAAGP